MPQRRVDFPLESGTIPCTIRKSKRSRHLRLAWHQAGELVVTAPWHLADHAIDRWVASQNDWIKTQWQRWRDQLKKKIQIEDPGYDKIKNRARLLLQDRVEHYSGVYKLKFKAVTVRNQRSRWGSCSSTGTLSFNYRLYLLPVELVDYVVVHELCHLKEMNHSPRFWALVAKEIPEYQKCRQQLRRYHFVAKA